MNKKNWEDYLKKQYKNFDKKQISELSDKLISKYGVDNIAVYIDDENKKSQKFSSALKEKKISYKTFENIFFKILDKSHWMLTKLSLGNKISKSEYNKMHVSAYKRVLKGDLKKGIISQEEYEKELKNILSRYGKKK